MYFNTYELVEIWIDRWASDGWKGRRISRSLVKKDEGSDSFEKIVR